MRHTHTWCYGWNNGMESSGPVSAWLSPLLRVKGDTYKTFEYSDRLVTTHAHTHLLLLSLSLSCFQTQTVFYTHTHTLSCFQTHTVNLYTHTLSPAFRTHTVNLSPHSISGNTYMHTHTFLQTYTRTLSLSPCVMIQGVQGIWAGNTAPPLLSFPPSPRLYT